MENQTSIKEFHILAFSTKTEHKIVLFCIFILLFLAGVIINTVIITVIYNNDYLHTPFYLFLCNLSSIDIYFTTTTVPNLLYMLLSGNNTVSLTQCFTQMYFFTLAPSTEDMLLLTMAYDRYLAICKPLHYHRLLNRRKCLLLTVGIWVIGSLNSLIFTIPALKMSFCHSNTIHQFFCDAKALSNIACAGTDVFYAGIYVDMFLFGLCPFLCSLTSYVKMISVILHIKSKDGRRKAFSTCSSHLSVIIIYYGTGAAAYLMPPSQHSDLLEQVITVMYTIITPILNPLIYSLRNKELKKALQKLLRRKL